MGNKRKGERLLAKALAKQEAQRVERANRILAQASRNAGKPGTHLTNTLIEGFTETEYEAFINECRDEAKKTKEATASQSSPNHVHMYDLLQMPNVLKMVHGVMSHCKQTRDALIFRSLADVIAFFDYCDVDICSFCGDDGEDLQSRYNADIQQVGGHSTFLKRMMVYSLRRKQHSCGKCDRLIQDFLYGAVGFESNHVIDDTARNEDERIKSFEVSARNFGNDPCDLLFEMCKTDLECWHCHNHYGANRYEELPDHVVGEYNYPARPCFEAQQDTTCKEALACIQSLCEDASSHTFKHVTKTFEANTAFYYKDCFLFKKDLWDCAGASLRGEMLHRVYLQVEKRMCGACLLCNEKFCNLPGRELGGTDLHHVDWNSKSLNPSEGSKKSFDESLRENRKLAPLCKPCHLKVHNQPGENDRFMSILGSKYVVDKKTGEISRK
eukprot:scaffold36821_cov161-Skeletonema_dohrnii-CCMP3373.AAC.1